MARRVPNPHDPKLVDVYDDAGNFLISEPASWSAEQAGTDVDPYQGMQDPNTGELLSPSAPAVDPVRPVSGIVNAMRATVGAGPLAGKSPEDVRAAISGAPEPEQPALSLGEATPILEPGSADAMASPMQPGSADEMAAPEPAPELMFPGTEGGWTETQRQSQGMAPEAVEQARQGVNALADEERDAIVSEALAREMVLEENRKRQLELENQVKAEQAQHALDQKLNFERRQRVERRIAEVSAQEPDRNRAFPTGASAVTTFIGSIAGGMLAGLTDGRYQNQTLSALEHRLDEDVRQQRETQSNLLKDLARQLGSIDAAEDMLRAKQKEIVLKETEARLLGSENKVAPAQIDAFRKRMNAEISRHRLDALTKLERDMTIQEVNTPGSAPVPFNPENYRARALQEYAQRNGLDSKTASAEWVAYNKDFADRAPLKRGLQTLDRVLAKYEATGDVAGLGALGGSVPTMIAGKDAKEVRQILGAVVAQHLKEISGAAVTEQEYGRTLENIRGAGSYDDIKRGVGLLQQNIDSKEEEARTSNPEFYGIRQTIRHLNEQRRMSGSQGRAEQERATSDIVTIPRESRIAFVHNNPGNLKYAGQVGAERGEPVIKDGKTVGHWAKFESVRDGFLALARQLEKDQARQLNVRQFVEKYAPASDGNRVEAYINAIGRATGADEATMLSDIPVGLLTRTIAKIESRAR